MSGRRFLRVRLKAPGRVEGRTALVITCGLCGASTHVAPATWPADIDAGVAADFRAAGWAIGTDPGGDRCPRCASRKESDMVQQADVQQSETKSAAVPVERREPTAPAETRKPAAPVERSRAAIFARALCDQMLFDHLDIDRRAWREDWCDERVARECGLSAEFVRARRERDYFVIAETPPIGRIEPVIAGFEADLEELRVAGNRIHAAVAALGAAQAEFVRVRKRIRERVTALTALLDDARASS